MFSILYVDDEPGLLEIGKMFLEHDGRFTVDTLTSAPEALEVLRIRHYDAIISDYQMPVTNGIEFLKHVRASNNTVPFIIFTGRGREEIVIQALNEGADFYLQKGGDPVSQFAELAHKVHKAILQRRTEASIRDHERREADIINFLPDATFAIDSKGVVIAWNRAMEKMTGVPSSEIIGKGDYKYALPFYGEQRPILIDLVLNDDPEIAAKYPVITRDGTTLFSEIKIPHFNNGKGAALWFTASPLYDTAGTVVGAIESIREITERKRVEEALNESEKFLNSVIENIPDMIFVKDGRDLRFIRFNKAGEELLGYTRKDLYGKNDYDFFPKDEADTFTKNDRIVLDTKQVVDIPEEKIQTRFRGRRILHTKKIPILDETGNPVYLMGISEDITEGKRAEGELKNSVAFLNSLIDQSPTPMWISDETGTLIRINRACCELLRIKEKEVVGKYSLFDDPVVKEQGFLPRIHDVFDKGVVSQFQLIYDTSRLTNIELEKRVSLFLDVTIFPVRDSRGVINHAVIQHIDITQRKQAEAALIESEQRYRNIVEDQTEFICRFRPDGTHAFVNEAYCRYFSLEREEIVGRRFRPKIPLEDQEHLSRFFASLTPDHPVGTIVHRIIMPDGRICWQRWSDRAIFDSSGKVIEYQSVGRDITETKETEKALRQKTEDLDSRNRLVSTLLDTIPVGIFMVEAPSGKPILANREATRLLGRGILSDASGENLAEVYDAYRAGTSERYPASEMPIVQGMQGECHHIDDMVVVQPDGTTVQLEVFGTPVTDRQGRVTASLVSFLDITGRKRAEQVISDANKKINLLTSMTRHDVTNQISVLRGLARIAMLKKSDPVILDLLQKIDASATAIAQQVEFSRSYQDLSVHAAKWQKIREMVTKQNMDDISISCTCNVEIFADPMLERVFFNLIDNAARHGEQVTTITVSCRPDPGGLVINVEDNGIGVPPDQKEKIFEKGYGKHTGFGLFLAREVLALTGISIRETGIKGKGARFEMIVPEGRFRFTS